MSTTRDTFLILAGVAIGTVSGFTIASVTLTPHEKAPEVVVAAPNDTSHPQTPAIALEPAAEQEHVARLDAEKERDALKAELAQVKSSSAAVAAAPQDRRRGRRDQTPQAPLPPPRPLATIGSDVDVAIAKKDAKRAGELLQELSRAGREGWPLVEKLAGATFESDEDDDSRATQQVRGELEQLMYQTDLKDLALDALLDAASHSAETRRLAADVGGGLKATPDQAAQIRGLLKSEPDNEVAAGMLMVLMNSDLDGAGALDILRSTPDAARRKTFLEYLTNSQMQGLSDTLSQIASSDPDPAIQKSARVALVFRNPTVQGYAVTGIVPNSQAASAGIQEGDVIVSYNGNDVKSEKQLAKLKSSAATDSPVQLSVYRDGQVIQLSLKPGSIGVYGGVVKPNTNNH